ncbi:MAG: phytoene desaturase family protein [Bacteroidia bacterium]|jgi:phytoene desaturase|nr:phytoene desaturase family protein [Bacteroidia bacterium]
MIISIIGSGIAGLASAVRLACAGHKVQVFEANSYPGGKLSEINQQGYRFDAGPSLFTLPNLVEELFVLAGKDPKDCFEYVQLEKACNYFYEDGTRFTAYHNKERFEQELKNKLGINNAKPVFKQLDQAAFRYNLTAPIFIEYSLHRLKNYTNVQTLKGILNAWRLNLFKTMHDENETALNDNRLVQYFNRFATYNGSSPYSAPALLNMIPHLEHNIGTFFPVKGMHSITQSIYQLAKELGVVFHFETPVAQIVTQQKQVNGVKANGVFYPSDIVVSNADIYPTFTKLLPNEKQPTKILQQEKSSSALIFYWGISRQFPELDLHNIFFSADYKQEFDCLFKQKTIYHDPTIYINITSKYKTDDAPTGCENWFVMVNVPNNSGQDWDHLIAETRKNCIEKLSRLLQVPIAPFIKTESVLDPRSIETKTSSFAGALYGNASNNRFAAFLRHKNFSSQLKGLYFCGGSVHPGGGIPLCLNSAKIVAKLLAEDFINS